MKINPLDNRAGILKSTVGKKSEGSKETFEAALDSRLKSSIPQIPSAGTVANAGLDTSGRLSGGKFLRADSIKKTEGLLFSLEMYKNSLANTEIRQERLSELLADMKEKSMDALKSGLALPADDPLRGILTEVRAIITNESRRFYSES